MVMRARLLAIPQRTLVGIVCSFAPLHVLAQTPTGTLAGRVVDPTGAAIPVAQILVINHQTGSMLAFTAASEGDYFAAALQPGTYDVVADAPGFQRLTRSAVIEAGSTTTLDFSLPKGTASVTVSVSTASPQMQYESHQISGVVTHSQVETLPLNGRSSAGTKPKSAWCSERFSFDSSSTATTLLER